RRFLRRGRAAACRPEGSGNDEGPFRRRTHGVVLRSKAAPLARQGVKGATICRAPIPSAGTVAAFAAATADGFPAGAPPRTHYRRCPRERDGCAPIRFAPATEPENPRASPFCRRG